MSLNGYVADKNENLDFFTNISSELNKYSHEDRLQFMEEIDTIVLGRKTYELFVDFWPEATKDIEVIAEKLNSTQKLVFSNSLQSAPWGKWPSAELVRGEARERIRELKNRKGKNLV